MSESPPQDSFCLDTPAARPAASNIDAYRQQIIHERWLSTLILSVHLEIEAVLEVLIHLSRHTNGKSSKARDTHFSTKVSQCEALALLEPKVIGCLRAVNKLRNELAHRLDNKPTSQSIYRFIESMSAMHPLQFTKGPNLPVKNLLTFDAIREHFKGAEAQNLDEFVFISLMLVRSTLFLRLKSSHGSVRPAPKNLSKQI